MGMVEVIVAPVVAGKALSLSQLHANVMKRVWMSTMHTHLERYCDDAEEVNGAIVDVAAAAAGLESLAPPDTVASIGTGDTPPPPPPPPPLLSPSLALAI